MTRILWKAREKGRQPRWDTRTSKWSRGWQSWLPSQTPPSNRLGSCRLGRWAETEKRKMLINSDTMWIIILWLVLIRHLWMSNSWRGRLRFWVPHWGSCTIRSICQDFWWQLPGAARRPYSCSRFSAGDYEFQSLSTLIPIVTLLWSCKYCFVSFSNSSLSDVLIFSCSWSY